LNVQVTNFVHPYNSSTLTLDQQESSSITVSDSLPKPLATKQYVNRSHINSTRNIGYNSKLPLFTPPALKNRERRKLDSAVYHSTIPLEAKRSRKLHTEIIADQRYLQHMYDNWENKLDQIKEAQVLLKRMSEFEEADIKGIGPLFEDHFNPLLNTDKMDNQIPKSLSSVMMRRPVSVRTPSISDPRAQPDVITICEQEYVSNSKVNIDTPPQQQEQLSAASPSPSQSQSSSPPPRQQLSALSLLALSALNTPDNVLKKRSRKRHKQQDIQRTPSETGSIEDDTEDDTEDDAEDNSSEDEDDEDDEDEDEDDLLETTNAADEDDDAARRALTSMLVEFGGV
ncbi:hypothetical protein F4703DRAFT_1083001, partial [Phycomyces blakesleeanus]